MKKKKRMIRAAASLLAVLFVLGACGRTQTIRVPVWPDGWVIGQAEHGRDSKTSGDAGTSQPARDGEKEHGADSVQKSTEAGRGTNPREAAEEGQNTADMQESGDSQDVYDNFYPDLSASAGAYMGIDQIYSLIKYAEGGVKLRYWGVDQESRQLTEIDYKKIFGIKDYDRSPLDYLMSSDTSYSKDSANILVTDMMSITGSEFGEWLISTGSQSFSFYVISMPFEGSIDFYGFPKASSSEIRHFHVNNCVLERDLLIVVFGAEERVSRFDSSFRSIAQEEGLVLDYSHISRMEKQNSAFALRPAPCFSENLPNILYKIPEERQESRETEASKERQADKGTKTKEENKTPEGTEEAGITNYNYGLALVEDPQTQFSIPETYLFKKSRHSANDNKKAVRAVFYGIPDASLGRPMKYECSVIEFDKGQNCWKDSEVTFAVSTRASFDGLPASSDPDTNKLLGGNIVEEGKVVLMTVENDSLPRGLYAVEAAVTFEPAENTADLRHFAEKHSAEVGDYLTALSNECTQRDDSNYVLNVEGSRVFGRLLDFRGMIDELTASGFSDPAADNKNVTLRLVIDNR